MAGRVKNFNQRDPSPKEIKKRPKVSGHQAIQQARTRAIVARPIYILHATQWQRALFC